MILYSLLLLLSQGSNRISISVLQLVAILNDISKFYTLCINLIRLSFIAANRTHLSSKIWQFFSTDMIDRLQSLSSAILERSLSLMRSLSFVMYDRLSRKKRTKELILHKKFIISLLFVAILCISLKHEKGSSN